MKPSNILFIDRDGTLIEEPADQQVDSLEKLSLVPDVITALTQLQQRGFKLVMISNQDGLGTPSFPEAQFRLPHEFMLKLFSSQGIRFDDILICPHQPDDQCECRKPKLGFVEDYIRERRFDSQHSYVIGDRETDMVLANRMGITGIRFGSAEMPSWREIVNHLLNKERQAKIVRKTRETAIQIDVNLDQPDQVHIKTGIGFFDHMLEQLAKHGGFGLSVAVEGDLEIDDHHTVEDTGIALGEAMRNALGDKYGIHRYGFLLPMDEAKATIALDLCGRSYLQYSGEFKRERVGDLSTELVPHFFRSFTDGLQAVLHIAVTGENTHHMIEAIFKGTGRALRQAMMKTDMSIPSTKGVL